ncbi:MAG: hypothetical protein AB1665_06345 [Candidatus Thermoplasmatota archaeon]
MKKTVHLKLEKDEKRTLDEVLSIIRKIQAEHPDREVYFDGDDFAICSRPKRGG